MRRLSLLLVGVLALSSLAWGTEYFVSPKGNDKADGRTEATALKTVGKGLSRLKPGDTLTVLPGEYFESNRVAISGKPGKPITIRAAKPGTAILRGDVDVSGFKPVKGLPYTWVTDFDGKAEGVAEQNTGRMYAFVPSPEEVSEVRGSCYQDLKTKKLYIHCADSADPKTHSMVVSVTNGFGIIFTHPRRQKTETDIIVDGLTFTGYMNRELAPRPGGNTRWGLYFVLPERCVVRRCTAYLNGGGIGLVRPIDCLVEDCHAFGNFSSYNSSGGNIISWTPAVNTIMRNNVVHTTNSNGIRFYGNGSKNCLLKGNLAYGCKMGEIWIKGGKNATSKIVHNVSLGAIYNSGGVDTKNIHHNLCKFGGNIGKDPSNIQFSRIRRFSHDANFADPAHHDYRLQSDSRLRGKGPNGTDPGPFPYQDEVFFVEPEGKDSAKGTSVKQAWRSLDQALRRAGKGTTVYALPGVNDVEYDRAKATAEAKGIVLRRRGRPEPDPTVPLVRRARVQVPLRIDSVRVHSVSATTANIEWWTPTAEATTELHWGTTPMCTKKVENIYDDRIFHTVSLAGLRPGTRYYFRVTARAPAWEFHTHPDLAELEKTKPRKTGQGEVESFRTLARDPAPRTYHVATNGSDANDGLSLAKAWRTVRHAATSVAAGDTVLIHAGSYAEHVPVRVTGDEDRPVTFRCAPGEQVWMDGSGQKRITGFTLAFKHYVVLDGLYFHNFRMRPYQKSGSGGAIHVIRGSHETVRRCFYDGRSKTYMPYFILALDTRDFTLANSVVIQGWNGVCFWRCPDLLIRNCVFYNGLIRNIMAFNDAKQRVTVSHNLICDNIPQKFGNSLAQLWHLESYRGDHNVYFSRGTDKERRTVRYIRVKGKKEPANLLIGQVRESTGQDRHSVFANPGIPVVKEMQRKIKRPQHAEVEMHRTGDKIRPLDFRDFFIDPKRPCATASDGKPVGLDRRVFNAERRP